MLGGKLKMVATMGMFLVATCSAWLCLAEDPPVRERRPEPRAEDGERPRRPAADDFRPLPRREGAPKEGPPRDGERPNDLDRPPFPPGLGRMLPPPRRGEELERMKEVDPEMYELMKVEMGLEQKSRELAEKARQVSPSERENLRSDAEKLVTEHFEARQKLRQLQVKRMEQELEKMKEALEDRLDRKDEIVEGRVKELLGERRDDF